MIKFYVNQKQYIAADLRCGTGIGIYDESGNEITVIPAERNWQEVATAAITCVDNFLAKRSMISTAEPALAA